MAKAIVKYEQCHLLYLDYELVLDAGAFVDAAQ
jgi:hypothetical protein